MGSGSHVSLRTHLATQASRIASVFSGWSLPPPCIGKIMPLRKWGWRQGNVGNIRWRLFLRADKVRKASHCASILTRTTMKWSNALFACAAEVQLKKSQFSGIEKCGIRCRIDLASTVFCCCAVRESMTGYRLQIFCQGEYYTDISPSILQELTSLS